MAEVQRGIRVFNQLLFEEDTQPALPKRKYSYRHPELIAARDRFLIHRFYYKSKIEQKFYLSKIMIQKIIQAKADDALLLKKQQITVKQLKEEWPHINW